MPTTAIILNNTPIACVLAGNDIANGDLFGQRLDPMLPLKIYITYTIIKKIYDIDPNYPNVYENTLYLWELMGKYGIAAMSYTGGGGSVSPITPITNILPIEFVVTSISFIPTGVGSVSIPQFIGYNLLFTRNNITQSTVDNGGTFFSWNKITGQFQCFGVAAEGELFQLYPFV